MGLVFEVRCDLWEHATIKREISRSVPYAVADGVRVEARLTTGSLIRMSFLKSGTLDMKSITAPAPAPPQSAKDGAHLNTAAGVLVSTRDA